MTCPNLDLETSPGSVTVDGRDEDQMRVNGFERVAR